MIAPSIEATSSGVDGIDYLGIIHKFFGTQKVNIINSVSTINSEESPDTIFHKIDTNDGVFWIYELRYTSSLDAEMHVIQKQLKARFELFPVKQKATWGITETVNAEPYKQPQDWEQISNFVTTYSGSQRNYLKFLIKTID